MTPTPVWRVGDRAVADCKAAGRRPGKILEVYDGEFGVPGATWVRFMPDRPIHYGCSVDVMTSELSAEEHGTLCPLCDGIGLHHNFGPRDHVEACARCNGRGIVLK